MFACLIFFYLFCICFTMFATKRRKLLYLFASIHLVIQISCYMIHVYDRFNNFCFNNISFPSRNIFLCKYDQRDITLII